MAKEMINNPQNIQQPQTKSIKKQTKIQQFKATIPPHLIPTKRIAYIIAAIFVIIIIIDLLNFPLGQMMSGRLDVQFAIGYPYDFFVLDLENPEVLPFKFGGLAIDTLIYLAISYAIDVAISAFVVAVEKKKQ